VLTDSKRKERVLAPSNILGVSYEIIEFISEGSQKR
jgi:hypothetical protein